MSEQQKMSTSEKKKEDWMNAKWRPMMGWMYMLVCTMDFIIFPVLWSVLNATHSGSVGQQWNPITLQGAGLFHMAMGAIIGVAAFGRTQEKLAGVNNGGSSGPGGFGSNGFGSMSAGNQPMNSMNSGYGGMNNPNNFNSSPSNFNNPAPNFGSPAPAFGGPVAVNASGKKVVPQDDQPLL